MGGWEPTRTTRFVFERVWWKPWTWFPVGAVSTLEPEWVVDDVDWLIASRDFEASVGGHGHPLSEATSREANPANSDGAYYYVAGPQQVDWAERARSVAAKKFRDEVGADFDMSGYFFPVKKVWRATGSTRR